jgi:hypothetical protein
MWWMPHRADLQMSVRKMTRAHTEYQCSGLSEVERGSSRMVATFSFKFGKPLPHIVISSTGKIPPCVRRSRSHISYMSFVLFARPVDYSADMLSDLFRGGAGVANTNHGIRPRPSKIGIGEKPRFSSASKSLPARMKAGAYRKNKGCPVG